MPLPPDKRLRGQPLTFNEQLLDAMVRHQIGLRRVAGSLTREVWELLDATEKDLRDRVRGAVRAGASLQTEAGIRRTEALLGSIRDVRSVAWKDARSAWRIGLGSLAVAEPDFVAQALRSIVPVDLSAAIPPPGRLRQIATSFPFEGRTMRQWASNIQRADIERLAQQVRIGMVQGESGAQIARRLTGTVRLNGRDGVTEITRRQARTLTQTATSSIGSESRQEFYRENRDLIEGKVFTATLDSRTTPVCVVGSTPVQPLGVVEKLYRREYRGEIVVIATASGKELTGTPNHPILTPSGWRALQELKPGDQVVNAVALDRAEVLGTQDVGVPASAAELFDAAADPALSDVFREGSSAADFHGDGMTVDGEVDIAVPKSELGLTLHLRSLEHRGDGAFAGVHAARGLCGESLPTGHLAGGPPIVESSKLAPRTLESGEHAGPAAPRLPDDLAGAGSRLEEFHDPLSVRLDQVVSLSALPMWEDSVLLEEARERRRGDVVLPSDRPGGPAVSIELDDVVSVRVEFRSTHVYNLQTCRGVYIAGGLIVHNCRAEDGNIYGVDEGPVLPLHMGERSLYTPTLDGEVIGQRPIRNFTENELVREYKAERGITTSGAGRDSLPRGTKGDYDKFARRRMRELTGTVPAKTTYTDFLRRQKASVQDDILGPTRGKLFRQGGVTLDRFVDREGSEIPLRDLITSERRAFELAGIEPDTIR